MHTGQSMAGDTRFSDEDVGDILDNFLLHHNPPAGKPHAHVSFDPSDVLFGSDPLTSLPESWQPETKAAEVVGFFRSLSNFLESS